MFRSLLHAGVALSLLGAASARAADVTPAQATALEAQLRDAIGGLLGPAIKIGDRPIQITSAGDHFNVVVPVPVKGGADMRVMATARPMDGGKWSVEAIRATSPIAFTLNLPLPPGDAQKKGPARKNKDETVPVEYTIAIKDQDGRIVWDPSFATPSTWTSSFQGMTMHAEGGPLEQDSKMGVSNSVTTLRPAGPDRMDVLTEATLEDYTIESEVSGSEAMEVSMKRVRLSGGLNGVSRAKGLVITQAVVGMAVAGIAAMPDGKAPSAPPKIAPELVRALLDALQDFASEFSLDETIDGLAVKYGDYTGGLEQMKLGFGAKSDAGLLRANFDVALKGLTLPGLPLGEMEALIPKSVAMRPFVAGVGVAELMRIAKTASEGGDPAGADIQALFSHGGISAGLESMSVSVAGANFTGQGKMVATSPADYTGSAQIVAENFDALMQKVSGMKSLAQAVPVMVFAKGIGRAENNRVIWDVTYKDGKVLVNNVDLSAMAGAAAPPPAKAPPGRPAPNRTR